MAKEERVQLSIQGSLVKLPGFVSSPRNEEPFPDLPCGDESYDDNGNYTQNFLHVSTDSVRIGDFCGGGALVPLRGDDDNAKTVFTLTPPESCPHELFRLMSLVGPVRLPVIGFSRRLEEAAEWEIWLPEDYVLGSPITGQALLENAITDFPSPGLVCSIQWTTTVTNTTTSRMESTLQQEIALYVGDSFPVRVSYPPTTTQGSDEGKEEAQVSPLLRSLQSWGDWVRKGFRAVLLLVDYLSRW